MRAEVVGWFLLYSCDYCGEIAHYEVALIDERGYTQEELRLCRNCLPPNAPDLVRDAFERALRARIAANRGQA